MSRNKRLVQFRPLFLLLFALCFPLPAQESSAPVASEVATAAAEPSTPTGQPSPHPLDAAELAQATEDAVALVHETRELLASEETVEQIRAEFSNAVARHDALSSTVEDPQQLSGATFQELTDQVYLWEKAARRLDAWAENVSARVQKLVTVRDRLKEEHERWELTRASSDAQGYPARLRERIQTTLTSIDGLATQVREARNDLLLLQDAVAGERVRLTRGLETLTRMRDERRRGLLASEDRPLWRIRVSDLQAQTLLHEMLPLSEARRARLAVFTRTNESRLALHGLILIGFLFLIYWLRRHSRDWDRDDPRVAASRTLFKRPISASLVAAVVLVPSLYHQPPLVVRNMIGLLVLVPAIRILNVLLPSVLHRPTYALIPLFLLTRIVEGAPTFTPLVRLMLLAEAALALGALVWVRRHLNLEENVSSKIWSRLAGLTLRGIAIVLVASIVANLLGKVQLAELLGTGGMRTGFLLLVLFMASRVLDAVVWAVLRTEAARRLPSVRRHAALIHTRCGKYLRIGLALLLVYVSLDVFAVREPLTAAARTLLDAGFSMGEMRFSLKGLLAFVFTVWAALALSRFVRFVLSEDVMPQLALPRGVPNAVLRLVHYAVLLIGFLLAVGAAGISLNNLVLLTGAFGVGIGFGLQNVVNNFVSGLILLFERPVQVGDVIEVGTLIGEVRHIGMRASAIRTWDGAEVIVPNGNLISSEVVNWTLSDRQRRVELAVGVAYGTELNQVIDLPVDVATKHEKVLDDPPPSAIFTGFGESSIDFSLRAWTADFDGYLRVKSELGVAIDVALKEAGITIPFPQRDLHVRSMNDSVTSALGRTRPDAEPD